MTRTKSPPTAHSAVITMRKRVDETRESARSVPTIGVSLMATLRDAKERAGESAPNLIREHGMDKVRSIHLGVSQGLDEKWTRFELWPNRETHRAMEARNTRMRFEIRAQDRQVHFLTTDLVVLEGDDGEGIENAAIGLRTGSQVAVKRVAKVLLEMFPTRNPLSEARDRRAQEQWRRIEALRKATLALCEDPESGELAVLQMLATEHLAPAIRPGRATFHIKIGANQNVSVSRMRSV